MSSLPTNQEEIFFEGDDYFHSLWKDLKQASSSILIEIYILMEDEIGKQLIEIIKEKSKSGIEIKLIIDAVGSLELSSVCIQDLKNAGIQVKIYHSFRKFFKNKINKRDHRKIVIIDQKIAYLGGMNFHKQESRRFYGEESWRDTHIRLIGEPVTSLIHHFFDMFEGIHKSPRRRRTLRQQQSSKNNIAATKNFFGRNKIRNLLFRYTKRSKRLIRYTTAYLVPDWEFAFALSKAKKRGARVQIITNGIKTCDIKMVSRVQRPMLRYLLKRGIEIYFYNHRMIHAKTAIFDTEIATIGSSNLNYRSFFRDCEINYFTRHKRTIHKLRDQFESDLKSSTPVTREMLHSNLWEKLLETVAYLFRSFF
ncbi:MAG: phosphatidylserine/phosphatidylglycerophosphate/cardiolipin synthase family protein [Deltaproteobacteria bacterium]|nr:phosphatidylserine/phosphatidylglycerophosphate/cardiolipin synthase family protein [Deltaproteobacteria bacterium]